MQVKTCEHNFTYCVDCNPCLHHDKVHCLSCTHAPLISYPYGRMCIHGSPNCHMCIKSVSKPAYKPSCNHAAWCNNCTLHVYIVYEQSPNPHCSLCGSYTDSQCSYCDSNLSKSTETPESENESMKAYEVVVWELDEEGNRTGIVPDDEGNKVRIVTSNGDAEKVQLQVATTIATDDIDNREIQVRPFRAGLE